MHLSYLCSVHIYVLSMVNASVQVTFAYHVIINQTMMAIEKSVWKWVRAHTDPGIKETLGNVADNMLQP